MQIIRAIIWTCFPLELLVLGGNHAVIPNQMSVSDRPRAGLDLFPRWARYSNSRSMLWPFVLGRGECRHKTLTDEGLMTVD